MRLLDEVILKRASVEIPDGFGGIIEQEGTEEEMVALVSIKNQELKAKPSGLGYYRSMTIIVNKTAGISKGDTIIYDGAEYTITRKIPYNKPFQKAFIGYEV